MKAIGIDIGTTSICGILLDTQSGEVLRSYTENSDAFLNSCAPWEKIQSVEKILAVALDILERLKTEGADVIGVTGQMHGILYFDASANPVSPLYTWQDERGNLPYKDTTYARYLGSSSGYGNVTDFYNRENGLRPKNAVGYCTIHDYFVMRLCGLKMPVVHASDAASLGCYDLLRHRFDYDYDAEITTEFKLAGEYDGIPVSVAIGDNQASVFSTLADEEDVLLNVGTGSQVSIISDAPVAAENVETRPYFDGKYLIVGSALCGGRAYSILKNFYSEILSYIEPTDDNKVYSLMNQMLAQIHASSLLVDTRFAGTRSNAELCGSISGITTENFRPSQLTLGVLEGMARERFDMYQKMSLKKCGIVGSGNGIRKNAALVKMFEEKFDAKMKIPKHLEEAAFGAALFGGVSCGIYKNAKEAQEVIQYG
ncbi:MAG: hypothetical protein IJA08_01025 [Clostridia bacterium]|nr:hypothetical protein [Clostridia bacterium]